MSSPVHPQSHSREGGNLPLAMQWQDNGAFRLRGNDRVGVWSIRYLATKGEGV